MKFRSSVFLLLALYMEAAAIDVKFLGKDPENGVNETLTPEDSEDMRGSKAAKEAVKEAEAAADAWIDGVATAVAVQAKAKKDWVESLPMCMEPGGTCGRHVEPLQNDGEGLSYMGCALLGTSYVCKVVWDTGSDQMVVVSTRTFMPLHPCIGGASNLGPAACYVAEDDTCLVPKSMFPVQIEYGSGGASILLGETTVRLGDGECPIHQGIAELSSSAIDVVIDGNINAIGGMAPFGNDYENVRTFSICFPEEDVSAPGVWVWNDFPCGGNPLFPGNFSTGGQLSVKLLHADDPYYWAIPAEKVTLGDDKPIGCPFGCAVIVDTGTSFMSLTHAQQKSLTKHLDKALCEDESIRALPWLHFYIKGEKLSMPPWEYIRIEEEDDMFDYVPDWWQEHVDYWREYYPNAEFLQKKKSGKKYQCYMALAPPMGSSKSKSKDNVILLGDSFMRKYHVTFCRDTMEVGFAKKISYDCTLGITKGVTVETEDFHTPRIVDNNYLQKRNELRQSGMGFHVEKDKFEFIEKKVKGESQSMNLRKIHPSKIMLGDAYHQLSRREGELEKVHAALHLRRQTILNASKQQSSHAQEI